jgi:hypothetical protein
MRQDIGLVISFHLQSGIDSISDYVGALYWISSGFAARRPPTNRGPALYLYKEPAENCLVSRENDLRILPWRFGHHRPWPENQWLTRAPIAQSGTMCYRVYKRNALHPGEDNVMKSRIVLIAALLTTLISFDAFACGDSLYRVGKGIAYRVYTAPLPGSVLVYGQSEGAKQLAQELARSGHGVRLVSNSLELQTELQTKHYDVVIAPYSDHNAVDASTAGAAGSAATFLPIALSKEEEAQANNEYGRVMVAEKDELKNYLKAIHRALTHKG